jgi:hypothetical protein
MSRRVTDGARIAQTDSTMVNIPNHNGSAGHIFGRQESSVGTEGENPEFSITSRGESRNLSIVPHAANQDRPIAEPKGIA